MFEYFVALEQKHKHKRKHFFEPRSEDIVLLAFFKEVKLSTYTK